MSKLFVLFCALFGTCHGFAAPMSRASVSVSRSSSISMDTSWRRSYDGRGGAAVAAPSASSAPSGTMSVPQACAFMAANPSTSYEAKKAFLSSKGVPAFVIAQAECAAPADNVQGHP